MSPKQQNPSRKPRPSVTQPSRRPRPPVPTPYRRLKPFAPWPSGTQRPREPPRLAHFNDHMLSPSSTWRNKLLRRRTRVSSTSLCLSNCPTSQPCGTLQCTGSFLPHVDGTGTNIPSIQPFTRSFLL